MKATINGAGRLIITPQDDLEVYALRKWWDDNGDTKNRLPPEVIQIKLQVETTWGEDDDTEQMG